MVTVKIRLGQCEACGQAPLELIKIDSGHRLCQSCLNELRGQQGEAQPQTENTASSDASQ